MTERKALFSPRIAAFCCSHSAYAAADMAGAMRIPMAEGAYLIEVPCAGKVEEFHILKAFEKGADGVLVLTCPEESCHSLSGNSRAQKRVQRIQKVLKEIGLEAQRLEVFHVAANQAPRLARLVNGMAERIRALGPSPANAGNNGR